MDRPAPCQVRLLTAGIASFRVASNLSGDDVGSPTRKTRTKGIHTVPCLIAVPR